MPRIERRKRKQAPGVPEYMTTYGDVVTLLLTFFILLISAAKIEGREIKLILAHFPGLGNLLGGSTFVEGPLPKSGHLMEALPSDIPQKKLDRLLNDAIAVLQPEISSDRVKVRLDERGLIISLASDIYFDKYSAHLNIQESGQALRKIALLLRNYIENNPDTPYRIESHTDEATMPVGSSFQDEWDLSSARSSSVLRFMKQFLLPTDNAQVAGFGNTQPLYESDFLGNAHNRRVDIVILNKGNL